MSLLYAGLDVSLEMTSICVVDADGRIVLETKVASDPVTTHPFGAAVNIVAARSSAPRLSVARMASRAPMARRRAVSSTDRTSA
ncbi:hypothetical protein CCR97_00075 [Rhodoplanes elegans]|nr:hypothetical protein [Rhodoplanes elegans]